jgi:hypothetical protein
MAVNSLTGADTVQLNDRVFADFGDGDIVTITYPNELVTVKTGKNGNSIYAFNETGKQVDVEIRVLRSSSDDKFLNSIKLGMERDFAAFALLTGEFVKRVGDGDGNVSREIYTLSGGVFSQSVDTKSNVEGDTDQSISVYRLKFTNAPKSIA